MNLKLKYGLPFTDIVLTHKGKLLSFDNFLIDTGSASTIIAAEIALELGLGPEPLDVIKKCAALVGLNMFMKNILIEYNWALKN